MPTVLALLPLLAADSPSTPRPTPRLLPRSSIAAVLARRGDLGLDYAQVKQLEERDAVLQKRLVEIREQLGAPASRNQPRGGARRAPRPTADSPAPDPAARAAELLRRLDDADTAAWLAAENLLREPQREPAREVAEKFREALADERDAERRR